MQQQREEEEQEAGERRRQGDDRLDAFLAADDHQEEREEGEEAGDGRHAVVTVDRIRGEAARLACDDDDGYAGFTDRAEEQAVRAVGRDLLTIGELQGDNLVADAAAVLLDVVAQDVRHDGFREDATIRVDELWLGDIVELHEAGEEDEDDERGKEAPWPFVHEVHRDSFLLL